MAGETEDKGLLEENKSENGRSKYPRSVLVLAVCIACERFAMSAMHAMLVLYFIDWLHFDRDLATALYHGFVILVFITPILGAILADSYWGRFKTIAILSVVHFMGIAIMTFTAFPPPNWIGPIFGLVLIAVGVGGIRPCFNAFGGDQFTSEQGNETFFSINYFSMHFGNLCAFISTPVLKSYVQCFGTSCYPLAFGVTAALVLIGTALFIGGSSLYKKVPPTGNVIGRFMSCLGRAIKNRWNCTRKGCNKHWLDHAEDEYEMIYIDGVKEVVRLVTLLFPLPMFSALVFQQGSRWTLQARAMGLSFGQIGLWQVPPGQMQALNAFFIVIVVPVFDLVIYPLCARCNFLTRPLQRMVAGMVFASLAFVAAGILQIEMDNHRDDFPAALASVKVINTLPCHVNLESNFTSSVMSPSQISTKYEVEPGYEEVRLTLKAATCAYIPEGATAVYNVTLLRHTAYGLAVSWRHNSLALDVFHYPTAQPEHGGASVGLLLTTEGLEQQRETFNLSVCKHDSRYTDVTAAINQSQCVSRRHIYAITPFKQSQFTELPPGMYDIYLPPGGPTGVSLTHGVVVEGGGVYTVNIRPNYPGSHQMESAMYMLIPPNQISVLWQIPQYILLVIAEVTVYISGATLTYTQAPGGMKSLLQAYWCLLIAVGNTFDAIVTGGQWMPTQAAEFFFFASLMALLTVVFAVMSHFYKYVEPNNGLHGNHTDEDMQELVKAEELPSRRDPGEHDKEGPSNTMYGTTNSN